jgi:hypothetical protein
MTPKLTDEMRSALQAHPDRPVTVEDEQTQAHYVLLPADVYERVAALVYDDSDPDLREFLPLAHEAFADDWDAPGMDAYETYPRPEA